MNTLNNQSPTEVSELVESTTASTGENTDGVKGKEGDDDDDNDEGEDGEIPEHIMCKQSEQGTTAAINNIDDKKLDLVTVAARELLSAADATFTEIPADEYLEKVALLQATFALRYNKIAIQYDKSKELPPSSIEESLESISNVCTTSPEGESEGGDWIGVTWSKG